MLKNKAFILLGSLMFALNFSALPVFADAGNNGNYPAAKPVFYKKPKTLIYKTAIIKQLEPDYSKLKKSAKLTITNNPNNSSKVVPAKTIAISLKQITLIKSPYIVKKVIYSKLSHIQVIHKLNNIFVSVLPLKKTEPNGLIRYIYSKSPKDIYIETPQKIYMLNLVPTDIPAQTIYLSPNSGLLNSIRGNNLRNYPPEKNKANSPITIIKKRTVVYTPQSSFVNINLKLIEDGFKQKIPAGFSIVAVKHKEYKYNQADITLESVMANRHYAVYTFLVKANKDIRLAESQFLFLVQKPMAVSIVNPVLKKYETTRVIIVGANNE